MKRIIYLLLCMIWLPPIIPAQEVIYFEDFSTVPDGTGFPMSSTEPTPVGQGEAYLNGATLTRFIGRFAVDAAADELESYALDGEVRWQTLPIDISCYTNVHFEVQFSSTGRVNDEKVGNDKIDYVAVDLTVVDDGTLIDDLYLFEGPTDGNELYATPNTFLNFCGSETANDIVITIRMATDRRGEGYNLDFVRVYGSRPVIDYALTCEDETDAPDLEVTATQACNPEFSLDGVTYFSQGDFQDLAPGNYTLYVRDAFLTNCTVPTTLSIDIPNCGTLLPIELVDFSGVPRGEDILLQWETATEVNNDHMVLEHSRDGFSFREIGKVKGAGTTDVPQYYEFLHRQAGTGLHYYRLRQVDLDGIATYHDVITVDLKPTSLSDIRLYPTVASSSIRIEWDTPLREKAPFAIYSLLGRNIHSGYADAQSNRLDVPLLDLPAGAYLFSIAIDGRQHTARFFRQ